jgi:hypothetical protein
VGMLREADRDASPAHIFGVGFSDWVPSSATIWSAIWGDRRTSWLRGRGQLLFSLTSHLEVRSPDRTIQGPRAISGTPCIKDGLGGRVAHCLRAASYQPSRLDWEKG